MEELKIETSWKKYKIHTKWEVHMRMNANRIIQEYEYGQKEGLGSAEEAMERPEKGNILTHEVLMVMNYNDDIP